MSYICIYSFVLLGLSAILAPAQETAALATVTGRVVDESALPIPGATASYTFAGPSPVSNLTSRPVRLRLGRTRSSPLTLDSQGRFRLTNLTRGEVFVCAAAPNRAYLQTCLWSGARATAVRPPSSYNLGNLVLIRAATVRFRIEDPLHLLRPYNISESSGLIVGVQAPGGAFHGSDYVSTNSTGRDYKLLVPFATTLRLWIYSKSVRVTDQSGVSLNTGGPNGTFQIPVGGPERRIVLNVTGGQ